MAVWNLDAHTGGLGTVSLTNYGSYASSLRVGMNASPRYDAAKYAMPKPAGTSVRLDVPNTVSSGETFTARATVHVPTWAATAQDVTAALQAPGGWTVSGPRPPSAAAVRAGQSATFTWTVRAPTRTLPPASALKVVAHSTQRGRPSTSSDERIVGYVPPPPPAGADAVSDLPFRSATNGWGPVERDLSVGGQAAGDGRPISIAGMTYAKGLGTNSVSDVEIYLGGACSRFTADVGVDDETNGAGTVTFSVLADGETLVTTPTIEAGEAATHLDVDTSGAQVLELVVGDAGDGNGNDHGDWARPTLTCS
jgi:hypothetical protein